MLSGADIFPLTSTSYSFDSLSFVLSVLLLLTLCGLIFSLFKLRQQRKLTPHVYNNTLINKEAICILSQQFTVLYASETFLHLLDSRKPLLKQQLTLYLDKECHLSLNQELTPHFQNASFWQGSVWHNATAGEPELLSLSITRLKQHSEEAGYHYLVTAQSNDLPKDKAEPVISSVSAQPEAAALLLAQLQAAINSCTATFPYVALMLLKFRPVISPDNMPHMVAEEINQLQKKISQQIPKTFLLTRLDNENFAIMLPPHLCNYQTYIRINRLAHEILHTALNITEKHEYSLLQGFIGISLFPHDGKDAQTLLSSAQDATYKASTSGFSNVYFASTTFRQRAQKLGSLESELHKGVQQNEFEVYFQPRLNISSHIVTGYEAVLRWQSPKRGILSPQHFFDLADETGLIVTLERFVFCQCCEQLKKWQKNRLQRGKISVHLSDISIQQNDLPEFLQQQLALHKLLPADFELMINESLLLQPPENDVRSRLTQLKEIGFQLTLDNFGEDVTSLSLLRHFPIGGVKFSRVLIKDLEHNEQTRNIVSTLVRLMTYLQIEVVANGIDNEIQAYLLHIMGCETLQGHLFSKALPASEIPGLLAKETQLFTQQRVS